MQQSIRQHTDVNLTTNKCQFLFPQLLIIEKTEKKKRRKYDDDDNNSDYKMPILYRYCLLCFQLPR